MCVCLGEEGGVVKTVKGMATVRIEGVAFVYGIAAPGLGNGGMCARKQHFISQIMQTIHIFRTNTSVRWVFDISILVFVKGYGRIVKAGFLCEIIM